MNVLTDLAADIYKAADVVSRELVGFIPSVLINADGSERAAKGDPIRSHFTRVVTPSDNSPSMTIPEGTDQTVDSKIVTIDKSREVNIPWTGEDIKHVDNGSGFNTIYGDQIAQAMRALTNEMESDLSTVIYQGASRAYGTAGTTPFDTAGDYTDASFTRKILKDNGCPAEGISLVMDTTAGATFAGKQADANRQGTDSILRQGVLLDVNGNSLRESAYAQSHTKGTGAGYLQSDGGTLPVGTTDIPLDTGAGTVLAGDVVTFAGDTNKYIVTTGIAAAGTIVLGGTGLRQTLANNVAMTVGASYTANCMFARSAAELVIRPPAMPKGGDAAVDSMLVIDPRSGLPFEIRVYLGKGKMMISVAAAWGKKLWKPEHAAILLG